MISEYVECPHCSSTTQLFDPNAVPEAAPARAPQFTATAAGSTNPVYEISERIIGNVEKAVVGKRNQIMLTLVAMFSEGHALLEDVPGVAKTMLARALAESVGGKFQRPVHAGSPVNDIMGVIFNPKTTEFEFRQGPLFAQIVLLDEQPRHAANAGGGVGGHGGATGQRGWHGLQAGTTVLYHRDAESGGSRRHVPLPERSWIVSSFASVWATRRKKKVR